MKFRTKRHHKVSHAFRDKVRRFFDKHDFWYDWNTATTGSCYVDLREGDGYSIRVSDHEPTSGKYDFEIYPENWDAMKKELLKVLDS